MACSICGESGHNSKTCPTKDLPKENNDFAIWAKVEGITEPQARELTHRIEDAKSEIAPQGRGTTVKAPIKNLTKEIKKALAIEDKSDGEK
ncbi:hypothetical protein AGMMS50212_09830 [Spirochaetia bacterium]|nr:hypothetical protein AGMMS50212_09830 [Spirochaetia bacterium]